MSPREIEIQSALLRLYETEYPSKENAQICDLSRISDGWENDVYSFAVEYGRTAERTREDLILRIYPGDDASQKSVHEYNIMKQLYEVGYPVPEVLLLEGDGALFGKPFVIMERILGRQMGVISDQAPIAKKLELLTLFCHMFVDLHALDWRSFAADPSLYETQELSMIVGHQLSEWQAYTHALQNDAFDPVFDWLCERLPDIRFGRPSLIHMDYHPYNILLREDGVAFVIDWTSAQVSDFRVDLAWTLLLMSSYRDPGARGVVLGEYERIAGRSVERIEYFDVIACLRRLASILISLGDGAGKLGMRPGAEAMMKNASHIEAVHTLLQDRTGITIPAVERLLSVL